MTYLKEQKNKESGFTILESIISIFILLTAITGPLTYVTSGFKAARQAKYQMVGYYLATETIEEIKYYRDNNKTDTNWHRMGLPATATNFTSSKGFDWNEHLGEFRTCNSGGGIGDPFKCSFLSTDSDDWYGYTNGDLSIFKRSVSKYETAPGNDDERIVTVSVGWDDGRVQGEIEITEHIFNIHTD